ncbi:hypothetical protein EEL31_10425 [Brevibacillus laterosporus]|nr:hypothetical protein EEL31_10425 [Brevibacillus laterosporus]
MIKSYKNYHKANITEKYMRDGNKLLDMTLNGLGGTEVVINGVAKIASVLSKYSKTEQWLKTLIMRNGDFNVGDIVQVNGRNWLVTILDQENPLYQKGTMIFCNQIIRWQDQLVIHESPCYVTKLGYIGGIEEDKNFTLPDKQMRVIIPETEVTSKIKRDKRFIFNQSVFKVIDLNLLNDGLIDLIVAEDISNNNDNFELMIADYTENEFKEPDKSNPIEVIGSDTIVQEDTEEFSWVFKDDENKVEGVASTWEITDLNNKPSSLATFVSHDINICTIQVTKKLGTFRLWIRVGDYTHYKDIRVKSLFG